MGGFDFDWNGKTYDIICEGGVPCFSSEEEMEAFEQWRVTPQGIQLFGPVPTDWSKVRSTISMIDIPGRVKSLTELMWMILMPTMNLISIGTITLSVSTGVRNIFT